ncbi:MAG: RNA polymerase sigma factor [Bacteroidota bacterium]|jgi:RNA polymerase sigma factor (sigma-70 family)
MKFLISILEDKEKGLSWLFDNYGKKLVGYGMNVYKITEDAAWELAYKSIYRVQEVYKQYTFDNENKFASFIFRVYINYLKNYIRDENTRTQNAVFIPLEESKRDFAATRNSSKTNSPLMDKLKDELEKLEDWQRVLLLMRSQGVSYSEIANYVSKPEEQLKVYFARLKNALTIKMQTHFPDAVQKDEAIIIPINKAS